MEMKDHWESVYQTRAPDEVSWYRPHLETSMRLIREGAPNRTEAIIDVGGGESTLVDDLLEEGYRTITVLDISQHALVAAQRRIGVLAAQVEWLAADITTVALPDHCYDVWHDRAVFHFLTTAEDRAAYVRQVRRSVRAGGYVIVATFGAEGPERCSGLPVMRYGAEQLHDQFGPQFEMLGSVTEFHYTPMGNAQQFLYCLCKVPRL